MSSRRGFEIVVTSCEGCPFRERYIPACGEAHRYFNGFDSRAGIPEWCPKSRFVHAVPEPGSPYLFNGKELLYHPDEHEWWVGYDFAFAEFIHWFWETVDHGNKVGRMYPEIEKVRNWIIDHRYEENV